MSEYKKNLGRIGILMGGCSSERSISLKSGRAVLEALTRQGYDVVGIDITSFEEGAVEKALCQANINLAFNVLHGKFGEDGHIQVILEDLGIRYTGSGIRSSQQTMNKVATQTILKREEILVPQFLSLMREDEPHLDILVRGFCDYPLIVKPACEGSSIGIQVVHTFEECLDAAQSAWKFGEQIIIEKYIQGRELTVGVVDQRPLPIIQITPNSEFFDFSSKYQEGMSEYIVPAPIDKDIAQLIQNAAVQAHRALDCNHMSRVDFILDDENIFYVLEVNTIPGFTETSLLPMAALEQGTSFDQLCCQLIELAHGKTKEKDNSSIHTVGI